MNTDSITGPGFVYFS